MAQSVPRGDIQTQPNAKIVFNAPYDAHLPHQGDQLVSPSHRLRHQDDEHEASGRGPAVLLVVPCDAFAFGQEDTNNDRITIEWTNTPDATAKTFRCEWFQGDGMVRRKNLPIEYNP